MHPPAGGPEANRLIHEKSPYLLQHATNPVDWYPWGSEAFAAAVQRDVPIFLSVGYSTCHWCHVMAHESFENEALAKLLNERFVAVKVDREERPDVDEIYMGVTQLLTSHGGWPNSVWLLPDGRPFFAGTYFPPEDRQGRPGFKTVLEKISAWWTSERKRVEAQADELANALRRMATGSHIPGSGRADREPVREGLAELHRSFDRKNGGFGTRPKFPPHGALALLLYEYERTRDENLLAMVTRTLEAIRLGGIHDHVGGGFARYATDDVWFLPHFEKMLYDNAQLARAYVDAWRLTGSDAWRRTAERTFDWVLGEMRHEDGGFFSAWDADSEGEEGKFYLWRRAEVLEVLGADEGELFCRAYNVTDAGNYYEEATGHRPGTSILYLGRPFAAIAAEEGLEAPALRARMDAALEKLRGVRRRRVHPHLDDKVLASWNGLMIGSLAHGGRVLERKDYVAAAAAAARFVLERMRVDGRLRRTWRGGEAKLNAYLDDHVFLAHGLLDLHRATGEAAWLREAEALLEVVLARFADADDGGFYFTSDDHEKLLTRAKDPFDKAIPSGNGMAAAVLVRLARATGKLEYLRTAARSFRAFLGIMQRAPRASESLLLALARYHDDFTPEERGEAARADDISAADAETARGPVKVEAFCAHLEASPGDTVPLALRITIDPGWHVQARGPGRLTSTRVALESEGAALEDVRYPPARPFRVEGSEPIPAWDGTVLVAAGLRIAADAEAGPLAVSVQVAFQACDDRRCLAPQKVSLPVKLNVAPGASRGKPRHEEIFRALEGK
jgi:uncharacterized protein YyaL (SSP411 family)